MRSPWRSGYGVRLATGRSRVRSLDLPHRHVHANGLESVSYKPWACYAIELK